MEIKRIRKYVIVDKVTNNYLTYQVKNHIFGFDDDVERAVKSEDLITNQMIIDMFYDNYKENEVIQLVSHPIDVVYENIF